MVKSYFQTLSDNMVSKQNKWKAIGEVETNWKTYLQRVMDHTCIYTFSLAVWVHTIVTLDGKRAQKIHSYAKYA